MLKIFKKLYLSIKIRLLIVKKLIKILKIWLIKEMQLCINQSLLHLQNKKKEDKKEDKKEEKTEGKE